MNPIALGKIVPPELIRQPPDPSQDPEPGSFSGLLRDALARVGEIEAEADQQVKRLLSGEPVDLHRVILASEKAGLAFNLMMSIRGKVVEAYQEVMRMQV